MDVARRVAANVEFVVVALVAIFSPWPALRGSGREIKES